MSDIETLIEGWRCTLLAREGMRVEHADELEDHLRLEIARLQGGALSEQETFLVAAHRLGNADAIAAEFEHADPRSAWRRRWIWMLSGYLGISVALRADLIAARYAELAPSRQGWGDLLFPVVFILGLTALVAFAWWTGYARRAANGTSRFSASPRSRQFVLAWAILGGIVLSFAPLLGQWMRQLSWIPDGMGVVSSRSVFLFLMQLLFWLAPTIALAILVWRDRAKQGVRAAVLAAGI